MQETANILSSLHAKGIFHGDITLNNVFYKKSKAQMVLGRPRLRQIDKFLQMPSLKEKLIVIAPEVSLGFTSSFSSDIWQLGVVFLQLVLREDI
jgi:serine/threonine protein kinase